MASTTHSIRQQNKQLVLKPYFKTGTIRLRFSKENRHQHGHH